MLRIISGKYKNRKLDQPPLSITRPTPDRVRESVFSILHFKIKNKIFVDLFSGSGANAFEAISRGAMKSYCIDNNKNVIKIIEDNILKIGAKNIEAIKIDAFNFIERNKGVNFDFIYIDPPYDEIIIYNKILKSIVENKVLSKNGYIIVETNKPKKICIPESLIIINEKKYGNIFIFVLTNNI